MSLDENKEISRILKKPDIDYNDIKYVLKLTKINLKEKYSDRKDPNKAINFYINGCGFHGSMFNRFKTEYENKMKTKIKESGLYKCYTYEKKSTIIDMFVPKSNKKVIYIRYNRNKYYRFEFDKNLI